MCYYTWHDNLFLTDFVHTGRNKIALSLYFLGDLVAQLPVRLVFQNSNVSHQLFSLEVCSLGLCSNQPAHLNSGTEVFPSQGQIRRLPCLKLFSLFPRFLYTTSFPLHSFSSYLNWQMHFILENVSGLGHSPSVGGVKDVDLEIIHKEWDFKLLGDKIIGRVSRDARQL